MRVRDLIVKLRQYVNGPPPVTCGQCGGPAVASPDGYARACGHTGELIVHASARVTGLGRANGIFGKTLAVLLTLAPQALDAMITSSTVPVRAELQFNSAQITVDGNFARLTLEGASASDVAAWVTVDGTEVQLAADVWTCLYECPPAAPEEPPQRLARLE